MSGHQKRLSAPTSWPVERKTHTFTVKAGAGPHGEAGVPLLVLLRDVLGYVDSRKEADYALSHDYVLVNGKPVSNARRPIGMFDILAFTEREEFYRVFPDQGGRHALTPIDGDAAGSKLGRIVGKRQVPGGETQLTLHDGETLLVDEEAYEPGDSLVVDNEDGSVVVHFPFEEGALVTAVDGQHAGEIGEVVAVDVTQSSGSNTVRVETEDGAFETIQEYVVVIDEYFTGDDAEAAADDGDEDESEAADDGEEASQDDGDADVADDETDDGEDADADEEDEEE